MSPADNQDVTAPSGAPTKTPTKGTGKWRNLIIAGAMLALPAASGWIAFGVGLRYENAQTLSKARNETNAIIPLVVLETSPGGLDNGGSGADVLTYLTPDGTLAIESGALLIGPNNAPTITASGSQVAIGTTVTPGGPKLEVLGTMSGSKLIATPTSGTAAIVLGGTQHTKGVHACYRDTDNAGWTALDCLNGTCTGRIASAGECP